MDAKDDFNKMFDRKKLTYGRKDKDLWLGNADGAGDDSVITGSKGQSPTFGPGLGPWRGLPATGGITSLLTAVGFFSRRRGGSLRIWVGVQVGGCRARLPNVLVCFPKCLMTARLLESREKSGLLHTGCFGGLGFFQRMMRTFATGPHLKRRPFGSVWKKTLWRKTSVKRGENVKKQCVGEIVRFRTFFAVHG